MECNVSELVNLGHQRAADLKASCGAVDVRTVVQLISDLATQLDVQLSATTEAARYGRQADITIENLERKVAQLAAELKQSQIDAGCYKKGMEASNARLVQVAAENAGLINSSIFTLQDGRPPYGFYASEWFIAKLKNGEYAALKALPEEYSHDYRTNDGTYYTKDWVVGWMQTPDTEYRPNFKTPATDSFLAEVRAQGVDAAIAELNQLSERSEKEAPVAAGHQRSAGLFLQLFASQLRQGGAV